MSIGRPYLTGLLDVKSRMPMSLNMGFEPPSYLSVIIEEQQRIAQLKQDDLIRLHFSWGAKIRNEYGLWDGTNQKLLNSCGTSSPDDASGVIIEQLWRTLRN